MTTDARKLYLDLLKKTITFTLWPEPPVSVETFNFLRPRVKRWVLHWTSCALRPFGLLLAKSATPTEAERTEGKIWPQYADTMIGVKRLENLQHCIETVLADRIAGDLIETGVWRGGACIFMRGMLAAYGITDRRVWLADSFCGLPPPDAQRWPADREDPHYRYSSYLAVSVDEVRNNFRRYDLLDDQVMFLQGWFADVLPRAPIQQLAILRLDGDMYGSTMEALSHLYPKLAAGGFCIVDDYGLAGCHRAVDDYRREHHIEAKIHAIDWLGAYWRKV